MSGSNQHYIPQFLLRGFRIQEKGMRDKIFVFRKGSEPVPERIKRIAADEYFYSATTTDGSESLDERITTYESSAASKLAQIRTAVGGSTIDSAIAAELVAHLTIRNAHVRGAFGSLLSSVAEGISDLIEDETGVRALFGIDRAEPLPIVDEQIRKWIHDNPIVSRLGMPESALKHMAFTVLKSNFAKLFSGFSPAARSVLSDMKNRADVAARQGHTRVLESTLAPPKRIDVLKSFSWEVAIVSGESLVLPDCVALALEREHCDFEPFMMASLDKLSLIAMPVTANRIIVGKRDKAMAPSLSSFNSAAAACSHDFFVGAVRTTELERLAEHIGERSWTAISTAVDEAFDEFLVRRGRGREEAVGENSNAPTRTDGAYASSITEVLLNEESIGDATSSANQSISISFVNCDDRSTAEKIAGEVSAVLSVLGRTLPLKRLDGITFTPDCTGALRDLDRGCEGLAAPASVEDQSANHVARAPMVVRDGIKKNAIVVRSDIGFALISDDDAQRRFALYVLAYMLAHTANTELLDESIPDALLAPIEDQYEGGLYGAVEGVWEAYFASRWCAPLYPERNPEFVAYLVTTLGNGAARIREARFAYAANQDLDALVRAAMNWTSDVMSSLARTFGHCDGLGAASLNAEDQANLEAALAGAGLEVWSDDLHRTLGQLWEKRGAWKAFSEFLVLNRLVERALWQFALFPWRTSDNGMWVSVPPTPERLLRPIFPNV
jgi:Protein of unknown function (DUF4238)